MAEITVISAITGGVLIGGASALLLYKLRRVAGISGIAAGLFSSWNPESSWRWCFLIGLVSSGPLYRLTGTVMPLKIDNSLILLAIAGLLVGYGTRLAGGCTSGHGICGLSRLSVRSIVATLVFMLTAGLTVYLQRHVV